MKPKRLKCGHSPTLYFDAKPGTNSWYCEYCFRFDGMMRGLARNRQLEEIIEAAGLTIPTDYYID